MERTVQVLNLPDDVPTQVLEDKLLIHFLRPKNGGGEIAEVTFPAGTTSALIRFEEEEVAERVKRVPSHVLNIDGSWHQVTVLAATAGLQLDQVISSVVMVIDFSKLPGGGGEGGGGGGGEALLRRLRETHTDVCFSHDATTGCCVAEGNFSGIRRLGEAVGRALGASTAATASRPVRKIAGKTEPGQPGKGAGAGPPPTALSPPDPVPDNALGITDFPTGSGGSEADGGRRSRRRTAGGRTAGGRTGGGRKGRGRSADEDRVLLMDTEIYLYIRRFRQDKYREILASHRVAVVDMETEGVTSLFLQRETVAEGEGEGDGEEDESEGNETSLAAMALSDAHRDLSELYRDLELELRKERFDKSQLADDPRLMGLLVSHLEARFPQINLHQDPGSLYLIGSREDCSLAKKTLQDLSGELLGETTGKGSGGHEPPGLRPSRSPLVSPPKADMAVAGKKDNHRLAANFSAARVTSPGGQPGVDQLTAGQSAKAHPSGPDPQLRYQMRTSHPDQLTAGQSANYQSKQRLGISGADALSSSDRGPAGHAKDPLVSPRENGAHSPLRAPEASSESGLNRLRNPDRAGDGLPSRGRGEKHHGPVKPYVFETSAGTLFQWESSAAKPPPFLSDGQPSRAGQLRRANSFSGCPHSGGPANEPRGSPAETTFTEELPVDSVTWDYLKDLHRTTVRRIGVLHGVRITDEPLGESLTVVRLSGKDRAAVERAKADVLTDYTLLMKRLSQRSLAYTELGLSNGADRSSLERWCGELRAAFPEVRFTGGQDGLQLIGPREMCSQAVAALQVPPEDAAPSSVGRARADADGRRAPSVSQLGPKAPRREWEREWESLGEIPPVTWKANASPSTDPREANVKSKKKPSKEDARQGTSASDLRTSPPSAEDEVSSESPADERSRQRAGRHVSETDTVKAKKTLPDKFHLAHTRVPRESHWSDREGSTPGSRKWDSREAAGSLQRDEAGGRRTQGRRSSTSGQESSAPRGPAPGSEEQESRQATRMCDNCKIERVRGSLDLGCAHRLCDDCYLLYPPCPVCSPGSPAEGNPVGTMTYGILDCSLEGHEHNRTYRIIYNISDGIQQRCDPNPGKQYKGGMFDAYLPDTSEGRRILRLLTRAFYNGFIFKIIPLPSGEEKVTWNKIPHKTSMTGGKIRDGYPDSNYLATALAALKSYGLE